MTTSLELRTLRALVITLVFCLAPLGCDEDEAVDESTSAASAESPAEPATETETETETPAAPATSEASEAACEGCRFAATCGGNVGFGCYRGSGDDCESCSMDCCAQAAAAAVPPGFDHDPELGDCGAPVASCVMTTTLSARNLPVRMPPMRTCLEYSLRTGASVPDTERAHMLSEWRRVCEEGASMRTPSVTVRGRTMGMGSSVTGEFSASACPAERRDGCATVGSPRTFCATNYGLTEMGTPTQESCEGTNGRFIEAPNR